MEKFDLFQLFHRMQNQLFDFNTLKLFCLPKPVCLQNDHSLTMFHLNNKWPEDFPSLEKVEKCIQQGRKIFYLPEEDYYYLYFHLLKAYKNFLKLNKEIYNAETLLDYGTISEYLLRNNLNATKFFELYFEKGQNLNDIDLASVSLKQNDESQKMISEPVLPSIDLENENENEKENENKIEIVKTVSELPSTELEIELENIPEHKIKLEEDHE